MTHRKTEILIYDEMCKSQGKLKKKLKKFKLYSKDKHFMHNTMRFMIKFSYTVKKCYIFLLSCRKNMKLTGFRKLLHFTRKSFIVTLNQTYLL